MSANQPNTGAEGGTRVIFTGEQKNPILTFIQRPRIMLILLALWSLLGFFAQTFPGSDFSLNLSDKLDGALGGFALGWEGIPLACVYLYCVRDPIRYHAVFWLGLIHMASMAASQVYHFGSSDLAFTGIIIPLAGSAGLAVLVFVHLFGAKEPPKPEPVQPG